MQYDSDFAVRLETLSKLGGDTSKQYYSVYEIDLAILDIIEGGADPSNYYTKTEINNIVAEIEGELAKKLEYKQYQADKDTILYMLATQNNSVLSLNGNYTGIEYISVEYSLDKINWNNFTSQDSISVDKGDVIYLRGIIDDSFGEHITVSSTLGLFVGLGEFECYGDLRWLHNYKDLEKPIVEYAFFNTFRDCPITKAPYFGGSAVGRNAFYSTFRTPNLIEGCEFKKPLVCNFYNTVSNRYEGGIITNLYRGCTNLIKTYPVTISGFGGLTGIYYGCTSLVDAAPIYISYPTHIDSLYKGCASLNSCMLITRADDEMDNSGSNNLYDVPSDCKVYVNKDVDNTKWMDSGHQNIIELSPMVYVNYNYADKLAEDWLANN
jgi:hypothetical protein